MLSINWMEWLNMYFLHLGSNVKTGDDVAIKLVSGMIYLYLFKAINTLYQNTDVEFKVTKLSDKWVEQSIKSL